MLIVHDIIPGEISDIIRFCGRDYGGESSYHSVDEALVLLNREDTYFVSLLTVSKLVGDLSNHQVLQALRRMIFEDAEAAKCFYIKSRLDAPLFDEDGISIQAYVAGKFLYSWGDNGIYNELINPSSLLCALTSDENKDKKHVMFSSALESIRSNLFIAEVASLYDWFLSARLSGMCDIMPG